MPFEDSLIGDNDFNPRIATESLIRDVTKEPLPADLEPHMLNTRLARKLNEKPGRIDYDVKGPEKPEVKTNPNDVDAGTMELGAIPTADGADVKTNPNDLVVGEAAPAPGVD